MNFLKNVFDFVLFTVCLKMIFAHWLAERIESYLKSSERNMAIWMHYQSHYLQKSHVAQSVLNCSDDKCIIFS